MRRWGLVFWLLLSQAASTEWLRGEHRWGWNGGLQFGLYPGTGPRGRETATR